MRNLLNDLDGSILSSVIPPVTPKKSRKLKQFTPKKLTPLEKLKLEGHGGRDQNQNQRCAQGWPRRMSVDLKDVDVGALLEGAADWDWEDVMEGEGIGIGRTTPQGQKKLNATCSPASTKKRNPPRHIRSHVQKLRTPRKGPPVRCPALTLLRWFERHLLTHIRALCFILLGVFRIPYSNVGEA